MLSPATQVGSGLAYPMNALVSSGHLCLELEIEGTFVLCRERALAKRNTHPHPPPHRKRISSLGQGKNLEGHVYQQVKDS